MESTEETTGFLITQLGRRASRLRLSDEPSKSLLGKPVQILESGQRKPLTRFGR